MYRRRGGPNSSQYQSINALWSFFLNIQYILYVVDFGRVCPTIGDAPKRQFYSNGENYQPSNLGYTVFRKKMVFLYMSFNVLHIFLLCESLIYIFIYIYIYIYIIYIYMKLYMIYVDILVESLFPQVRYEWRWVPWGFRGRTSRESCHFGHLDHLGTLIGFNNFI